MNFAENEAKQSFFVWQIAKKDKKYKNSSNNRIANGAGSV